MHLIAEGEENFFSIKFLRKMPISIFPEYLYLWNDYSPKSGHRGMFY